MFQNIWLLFKMIKQQNKIKKHKMYISFGAFSNPLMSFSCNCLTTYKTVFQWYHILVILMNSSAFVERAWLTIKLLSVSQNWYFIQNQDYMYEQCHVVVIISLCYKTKAMIIMLRNVFGFILTCL